MGALTMDAPCGGGSGMQRTQIQSLVREGSLYSLTLNEVQSHLGEPLHSMNLDELLKNVFPDEANQGLGMDLEGVDQYASSSSLQRQGSFTMPRSLSKKTVDEVWRDIQDGHQKKGSSSGDQRLSHEQQLTLGEMTLEDFLVKAGVVSEGSVLKNKGNVSDFMARIQGFAQGANWLHQYQQMPTIDQHAQQHVLEAYMPRRPVSQSVGIGVASMLDAMYPEAQVCISSPTIGALSDSHTGGYKRASSGDIADKLVERKHKRMIKNRESAARSRARKQAYTHELENKVSRLEEENNKLKKQKEFDKILHFVPPPDLRHRLRRTCSSSF